MVVQHDCLQHLLTTAGWIAALVPLATVLMSIQLSPVTNWTARAAVAGFSVLAVLLLDAALLVTIAFVGFGIILSHFGGVPGLRVTEVLVPASLLGCCVRALLNGATLRGALSGRTSVPVVLFALAAIASTIVWQQVYPFLPGYPSTYTDAFLQFVTRDYFVRPRDFWVLVSIRPSFLKVFCRTLPATSAVSAGASWIPCNFRIPGLPAVGAAAATRLR